ncbi:MAG: hypothetical protein VR75_06500 [Hyphomonadaceae bacterium BRH_c29]|nr:MAG: hypothetical protein VR75_06500 [Hyphomonadaceae bacterium BRH_c29]
MRPQTLRSMIFRTMIRPGPGPNFPSHLKPLEPQRDSTPNPPGNRTGPSSRPFVAHEVVSPHMIAAAPPFPPIGC